MRARINRQRLIFPIFNGLVCAILGGTVGYYVFRLFPGILFGAIFGLSFGIIGEILFGLFGVLHGIYKRRVLILILIEIPLAVFIGGPIAYVEINTQPIPNKMCCVTPLDYGAAAYEEISFETNDHLTIKGWYVPPTRKQGAVIIILHGARGDRRGCAWFATQAIQAGYGVLLYDQRALGESEGDLISFGWLDGPDLLNAAAFLKEKPEVDPQRIGVIGLSGGGHIAINAAYEDPTQFAAIWVDGVQAQGMADFPEAKNIGEKFSTFINFLILKGIEIKMQMTPPPSFMEILQNLASPPMVMVAGQLDDFEYRANLKFSEIISPNTEIWIIPNAGHVGGPLVNEEQYKQKMLEFFDQYLFQN